MPASSIECRLDRLRKYQHISVKVDHLELDLTVRLGRRGADHLNLRPTRNFIEETQDIIGFHVDIPGAALVCAGVIRPDVAS